MIPEQMQLKEQAGAGEGNDRTRRTGEGSAFVEKIRKGSFRRNGGTMSEELYANRKHKDTVFRMLYSDKRAILELYNALNGTDYQNPDDLTVTTLENAVYLSMKNDVSFLLDERMTLYEHQSTWNPNMPLRDLLYIARLMEKSVNKKSLYQSEMIKIPAPHFVVFYNGKEKKPEDTTIKLSDAFLQKEEEPELELKVRYLNINQGCNQELMKRCRTLREYSEFVARIRKYTDGKTAIEEAVDRAVPEYVKKRISEEKDIEILSAWLKEAVRAGSLEKFMEKTGLKVPENQ